MEWQEKQIDKDKEYLSVDGSWTMTSYKKGSRNEGKVSIVSNGVFLITPIGLGETEQSAATDFISEIDKSIKRLQNLRDAACRDFAIVEGV